MGQERGSALYTEEVADSLAFAEVKDGLRVREFWVFVAGNADVLVESERAPGYKAPFGVLMGMCAAEVTEENVEQFFAEAQAMIARARRTDEEKPEAEDEPADEDDQVQGADNEENDDQQAQTAESEVAVEPGQLDTQKGDGPAEATTPATEVESGANGAEAGEDLVTEEAAPLPLTNEVLPNEPKQATVETVKEAFKMPFTKAGIVIPRAETKNPKSIIEKTLEDHRLANQEAKTAKSRPRPGVETVFPAGLPPLEKLSSERDPTDAKPKLPENYPIVGLVPGGTVIERSQEVGASEDPISYLAEELPPSIASENESSLGTPEISVPIEEIEETILSLVEHIEEFEAEEVEVVHRLLDEIVEVASAQMSHEIDSGPSVSMEAQETEEKLKELWVQLFSYVGIDCSPELLESIVKLTLQDEMLESILAIKEQAEKNAPHDRGTHEIINQLLAKLKKLKEAIVHAYNLGRSALQLYKLELATA